MGFSKKSKKSQLIMNYLHLYSKNYKAIKLSSLPLHPCKDGGELCWNKMSMTRYKICLIVTGSLNSDDQWLPWLGCYGVDAS